MVCAALGSLLLWRSRAVCRPDASVDVALKPEEMDAALNLLTAHPSAARVDAFKFIRRALGTPDEEELKSRIQHCLHAGLVQACTRALAESPSAEERIECTWIFANICLGSHEQTMAVVPAVPLLAMCMVGDSTELAEHASWTIGEAALG